MKTVLFAPGGGEDLQSRDYQSVMDAIAEEGYDPKFVPITWARRTIDSWARELRVEYDKYDPNETILSGFSWGSMAAFIVAAERPPSALWLFSFSPFFSDDWHVTSARKGPMPDYMGKRRLEAFERLDFAKLAAKVTVPTLIFKGEDETPELQRRCEIAARELPHAQLITVPNTHHNVEKPAYIEAICQNI